MKKLKLKKNAKIGIVGIVALIIFISIGVYSTKNIIEKKNYEKTYEYKLINIGYSKDESDKITTSYKDKEIEYILKDKYNKIYVDVLSDKYFIYDNLYRYLEYYKNNSDKAIRDIVEVVNVGRDKDYYTDSKETDVSKNELMLVNKYNYLKEDYEVQDLVNIPLTYAWGDAGSQKINKNAYDAFINLWNDAKNNGYYFVVCSSYRTYQKQLDVYNSYKRSRGEKEADKIAARAGYSEHETGYTIDMYSKGSTQSDFQNTEAYEWLIKNAHRFGFIQRYPLDKENVTGYSFESWHYRYVGIDAATYIYENNITFDEYYAYFVK